MSTSAKNLNFPQTIAILGLGLMGGSLAAACRRKYPDARIIGISRSKGARAFARREGWVHIATDNLETGLPQADLVVLCTPVDTFPKLLRAAERFCASGTLVTDVGSVKAGILRQVETMRLKKIAFVGAHPMTGLHERGITVAAPELYDQGFTFLVRSGKTQAQAYARVKAFWKKINGRVAEVSAGEHDRITAAVSHLPHALAVCLMLSVSSGDTAHAARGFRDMTRLAEGDPSIWVPIFRMNRGPVLRELAVFERTLKRLRAAIRSKSGTKLEAMTGDASRRRRLI